ncbi:MAG: M20 family peptidase [Deltaproteobacteria bacterium]|nr:M20 family peptidase [Deltaproteobacteria bacterium]
MPSRRRKRLALGALAAVLGFAGLLCARAATLESKQPKVAPLPPVAVDGEAVAKILGKALARKTVSTSVDAPAPASELEGLHADLEAAFPKLHAALKKEKVEGLSLLYTWQGSDPSLAPIILCAHQDVVPIEPGTEGAWTHPPFDGLVDGGFVWGRGALDDKGSLVTILAAVEMLLGEGMKPARTVYLAFGHDEEITGKKGAAKLAELLASRNVKAEMALDEGSALVEGVVTDVPAPVAAIGIAEKGYVSVDLTVELPGGHSSTPAPENALTVLARAVERVREAPMPARIDGATGEFFAWAAPEMPFGLKVALANRFVTGPLLERKLGASQTLGASIRTTTAPTMFHAGVKDNVVPAKASATINFRVLPGDTTEGVVAHVTRAVSDPRVVVAAQEPSRTEPSPVSRSGSRAFGLLAETVREVFPGTVVAPSLVLGATDGRWYTSVAADVYRFLPFRLTPADIARIHGKDERLAVSSVVDGVRFYRRLLERASAAASPPRASY